MDFKDHKRGSADLEKMLLFFTIMQEQAGRLANPIDTSSLSHEPKQKVIPGQGTTTAVML